MFLDLLHFGSGAQAIDYFVFSLVAVLGTLQGVAVRYHRDDLLWIDGRMGYALAGAMIAGSYAWYFLTDSEIFIPGLAGGELFILFVAAFAVAIPVTRAIAFAAARVRALNPAFRPEVGDEDPQL